MTGVTVHSQDQQYYFEFEKGEITIDGKQLTKDAPDDGHLVIEYKCRSVRNKKCTKTRIFPVDQWSSLQIEIED